MSVEEFDNGYYYAADLKVFAREVGIAVGNFRKIELEELIRAFLRTGKVPERKPVMPRKAGEARDELKPDTGVANYVGDKKTKAFLLELVHAEAPDIGIKSGQWYWLNDWRRKKQEAQACFTYRDLADRPRALMQTDGRLPRIPHPTHRLVGTRPCKTKVAGCRLSLAGQYSPASSPGGWFGSTPLSVPAGAGRPIRPRAPALVAAGVRAASPDSRFR